MNNANACSGDFLGFETCPTSVLSELDACFNEKSLAQDAAAWVRTDSKAFSQWINRIEERVSSDKRALILSFDASDPERTDYDFLQRFTRLIGAALGDLLVQNDLGDTVITVYDRDRYASMLQGARYHQTREGGSIHTDNVNIPEPWDYLLLSCLAPAEVGGENILVDGVAVHRFLARNHAQALRTLEGNFYWEMRGVADSLYQAPIVTYGADGEPMFRHLRPYMESAHQKADHAFTDEQVYAIDLLDAVLNSSDFQVRHKMRQGEILLTLDAQVLHGRTCYSDALSAVSLDDFKAGKGTVLKRTMQRIWVRK